MPAVKPSRVSGDTTESPRDIPTHFPAIRTASSALHPKLTCFPQANVAIVRRMPGRRNAKRRSGCPVSASLEMFGDRWSLLIVRDLMIRGFHSFKDFQESGEGIATNVLADRLRKLEKAGIISRETEQADARRINYRLTEVGIGLAPAVFELLLWGARHAGTGIPCAFIDRLAQHREEILAEVRRRWRERDLRPLQAKTGQWQWP